MRMIFVGWDSNPAVDVVDFDIGYGTRPPHAFVSAGTPLESVSTDLYALSRGFIPGGIMIPSGMETRHTRRVRNEFRVTACIPKFISGLMRDILSGIETKPIKTKSFYPIEWKNLFAFYTHFVSFRIKSEMCRKPSPNVSGLLFKVQYQ